VTLKPWVEPSYADGEAMMFPALSAIDTAVVVGWVRAPTLMPEKLTCPKFAKGSVEWVSPLVGASSIHSADDAGPL
jgi:hypothetical protein